MKVKEFVKKNYDVFTAPIITVAVLIFAYALGGVFPFGSNNVEYYDMAQGIIPNFYHIWDALHSRDTALWFNWYSGLGVNDTANASLSAFWVVLLAVPRHWVGRLMSFYVVMMFSLSAFTAGIYLKCVQRTAPFITTMLSLCYAFCGFSVMYYTNAWQDTVYLFPLLIFSWDALMKKGRVLPYIIMIVINLMCGYYVFTLALIYVFFMSFLYITLCVDKQERGQRALQLGLSTALGVGISAVFFVPKLIQTVSSERFVEKTGFDFDNILSQYFDIAKTISCSSYDKLAMLFCTAFPLAVILIGIIRNRNDRKTNIFFVLNLMLMLVLIVCEGANALSHIGDYKLFPMRMGYVLSFGMLWAAGHYSAQLKSNRISLSKKTLSAVAVNAVAFAIVFALTYFALRKLDASSGFMYAILGAMPVLFVGYLLLLSVCNKFFDYRVSLAILLAEIVVISSLYVPYWNTENNTKEHNASYIATTQSLVNKLDIKDSKTDRIKTIGTTLNTNYGIIARHATIADWTHLIPSDVQKTLISLGYSGEYTRLHDSGGTAFTDALLGIKQVLSVKEEDSSLYKLESKSGKYGLYRAKYTLPYGIAVSDKILEINPDSDWKELNNQLYTVLSGDDESLISSAVITPVSSDGNTEVYSVKSIENTVAYFRLDGARDVNVLVNGKKLQIPTIDNEKNKRYPGRFNRNLICLGELGNGEVELSFVFHDGKYEDKKDFRDNDEPETAEKNRLFGFEVGLMSLDKLQSVCSMYSDDYNAVAKNYSLTLSAYGDGLSGKVLLLPLQYNECWSARVNGNNEQVLPVMNLLSAVRLSSDSNAVELNFRPRGLQAGAILSAMSLFVTALFLILRKKGIKAPRVVCNAVYLIYAVAFVTGIVTIYAIPLCYLAYCMITDFRGTIGNLYVIGEK